MSIINAAIVTISDTRSAANDLSGDRVAELLEARGHNVTQRVLVTDDTEQIKQRLMSLADRGDVNLILTTGGTGCAPRDNTPEATHAIIGKEVPGIAEAIRAETLSKTPMAMVSRGIAGIRSGTLIINLPGSPKAVEECFAVIEPVLEHAIALLSGPTAHEAE